MSKGKGDTTREGYESDSSAESGLHQKSNRGNSKHSAARLSSEPNPDFMAMVRSIMEEQARAESSRAEARRVEEAERMEARRLAEEERDRNRREQELAKQEAIAERERNRRADELALQEALAEKQFQQQVALMRLQAEIGEAAAKNHRLEVEENRKRDRTLSSIHNCREGEDIEEFLLNAEGKLKAGGVKEEEWSAIIASKLSGRTAGAWRDLCGALTDYWEVKERLLKSCGYTPKLAAEVFYGFKSEHTNGLTAAQLYLSGSQLLRRIIAPNKVSQEVEFALLRGWVCSVIPKRARVVLDSRVVSNEAELVDALQDHLILEGDRTEGQAAIFKKAAGEGSEKKVSGAACFKCGKLGHKQFECWQGKSSSGGSGFVKPVASPSVAPTNIICYSCGEEGHKSPQCPKNIKGDKPGPNEGKARPLRRIWRNKCREVTVEGTVSGHEVRVLLDSGASITVVPESLVSLDQRTGSKVAVKPFGRSTPNSRGPISNWWV